MTTASSAPSQPQARTGASGLIVGLAVALALAVLILAAVLANQAGQSAYLSIEGEITGTVTNVNFTGEAIGIDTEEQKGYGTRVLNAGEFDIQIGETVTGTLVKIPVENGTTEAMVIHEVQPGS